MELCVYPPAPLDGASRSDNGCTGSGSGAEVPDAVSGGAGAAGAAGEAHAGGRGAKCGGRAAGGRLPMSWSCTDEAVLQVPTLIGRSYAATDVVVDSCTLPIEVLDIGHPLLSVVHMRRLSCLPTQCCRCSRSAVLQSGARRVFLLCGCCGVCCTGTRRPGRLQR